MLPFVLALPLRQIRKLGTWAHNVVLPQRSVILLLRWSWDRRSLHLYTRLLGVAHLLLVLAQWKAKYALPAVPRLTPHMNRKSVEKEAALCFGCICEKNSHAKNSLP